MSRETEVAAPPAEKRATLQMHSRPLAARNLDELERDLAQLERMLTPLLNQVRAMQGKRSVIVPKDYHVQIDDHD